MAMTLYGIDGSQISQKHKVDYDECLSSGYYFKTEGEAKAVAAAGAAESAPEEKPKRGRKSAE